VVVVFVGYRPHSSDSSREVETSIDHIDHVVLKTARRQATSDWSCGCCWDDGDEAGRAPAGIAVGASASRRSRSAPPVRRTGDGRGVRGSLDCCLHDS